MEKEKEQETYISKVPQEDLSLQSPSDAYAVAKAASEKIQKGLEKSTASTGTPMDTLAGGAEFMAKLSNIGGGSKDTGGDGIKGGLNTIAQLIQAKTIIESELADASPKEIEDSHD